MPCGNITALRNAITASNTSDENIALAPFCTYNIPNAAAGEGSAGGLAEDPVRRPPAEVPGSHSVSGTGWISSVGWPERSWMRWTAFAEGASERQ